MILFNLSNKPLKVQKEDLNRRKDRQLKHIILYDTVFFFGNAKI